MTQLDKKGALAIIASATNLDVMAQSIQSISDISAETLLADPYPAFDRIRAIGSAVQVDAANLILVTRFDDIAAVEQNAATFASTNPQSLMNKFMGHTLMRKDFEDHAVERKAIEPSFRPGTAKNHWAPIFSKIADELIDGLNDQESADLFNAFAAPMASLSLIQMLGFQGVKWQELADWSQSLMDAVANYSNNPQVTEKGLSAGREIDDAIDAVLPHHRADENPSVLSSMLHADKAQNIDQIRANVKVIIGGGLNEPRDSILTTILALLQNPDQRQAVEEDPDLFAKAFDEAVRWVAPIGMYPRLVQEETVLGDTRLPKGVQIGICVGAANRDPKYFDDPHVYDLHRSPNKHLGFGRGPHFCAGAWVSRQMVGEIAVPKLFKRLKNLRLDPRAHPVERGWVFRGPTSLPVVWDK